jgi:hypothetical protein
MGTPSKGYGDAKQGLWGRQARVMGTPSKGYGDAKQGLWGRAQNTKKCMHACMLYVVGSATEVHHVYFSVRTCVHKASVYEIKIGRTNAQSRLAHI